MRRKQGQQLVEGAFGQYGAPVNNRLLQRPERKNLGHPPAEGNMTSSDKVPSSNNLLSLRLLILFLKKRERPQHTTRNCCSRGNRSDHRKNTKTKVWFTDRARRAGGLLLLQHPPHQMLWTRTYATTPTQNTGVGQRYKMV